MRVWLRAPLPRRELLFLFSLSLLFVGGVAADDCCVALHGVESCSGRSGAAPVPGSPGPPPSEDTHLWYKAEGSEYSYESTCQDGTEIDPVTMIITNAGDVSSDFEDVGWGDINLTNPFETLHHYRDNGGCVEGAITQATNDGVQDCWTQTIPPYPYPCPQNRWHARCNVQSQLDPFGRVWATCSPHWDEEYALYPNASNPDCWHVVPEVYAGGENYSGDGFTVGRNRLWWDLVEVAGHQWMYVKLWGNDERQQQCDGQMTRSNGWVDFVNIQP